MTDAAPGWAFRRWWRLRRLLRPREIHVTLFYAGLVGALSAVAYWVFREALAGAQWLFTQHDGDIVDAARALPPWRRALTPAAGGLFAGLALYLGSRLTRGQKMTDYMEAAVIGDGVIRARPSLVRALSALFTNASGGSIGREGPVVQMGTVLASMLGRLRGMSPARLRLMVACGGAAGIASVYNAPIAGALFMAEIVLGSIAMETFGPLIVASVVGTVLTREFLGGEPIFGRPTFLLTSPGELLLYTALGLGLGVAAALWIRLLRAAERGFQRLKWPPWLRLAAGGMIVGAISLGKPEVWGNGYSVVNDILHGGWLPGALTLLLFAKLAATLATAGSGAAGGVFTPTLFLGVAMGALFGQAAHGLWPAATGDPEGYALVGMGSFLAATTHAPLTAVLMVFEMTLDYDIVLPLMVAAVLAYFTGSALEKSSVYSRSLERVRAESPAAPRTRSVGDLLKPAPACVVESSSLEEVARRYLKQPSTHLEVVDAAGRLVGAISMRELDAHLHTPELARLVSAGDVMQPAVPAVPADALLGTALELFAQHDRDHLPVVDPAEPRRVVGLISRSDVLLSLAQAERN
ncbi:MAG: ClcB-like voltage-gated chloride channel protein [Limisphaerales bacterium]